MTPAIVRPASYRARLFVAVFLILARFLHGGEPAGSPLRLYVFDNGSLIGIHWEVPGVPKEIVAATEMVSTSYLIVHPKGTLLWDAGQIPDEQIKAGDTRDVTGIYTGVATKTLESQLAAVGYAKTDITYLALSHYHDDHAANANDFAGSTWLVQKPERDFMFSEKRPENRRKLYSALANSQTRLLEGGNFDVFGDGTVVIVSAYGHTPGHQVLQVTLAKTGVIILAGDLYHYQEQRGSDTGGPIDFNKPQSVASRKAIEALLKTTGAQLWLGHDLANFKKLKIAPAFYD